MQSLPRHVNPFAMMLDPQAVIAQIERSERLGGLHRRVCRPLDKPLLGGVADEASEGGEVSAAEAGADGNVLLDAESGIEVSAADGRDPQRHD
ncbi:MAG: hypothetical protein H7242_08455 [Microbacteriaceae bacterium]|nr:hypothetical protein [Burkholderiaceae bacterium]